MFNLSKTKILFLSLFLFQNISIFGMEEKKSESDTPNEKLHMVQSIQRKADDEKVFDVASTKLDDKKGSYFVGSYDTETEDSHGTQVDFEVPCDDLRDLTGDTEVKVTKITTSSTTTPNPMSGGLLQDNSFPAIPEDKPTFKSTLNDGTSVDVQVHTDEPSKESSPETYYDNDPSHKPVSLKKLKILEAASKDGKWETPKPIQIQDEESTTFSFDAKEEGKKDMGLSDKEQKKVPVPPFLNQSKEDHDKSLNKQLEQFLKQGIEESWGPHYRYDYRTMGGCGNDLKRKDIPGDLCAFFYPIDLNKLGKNGYKRFSEYDVNEWKAWFRRAEINGIASTAHNFMDYRCFWQFPNFVKALESLPDYRQGLFELIPDSHCMKKVAGFRNNGGLRDYILQKQSEEKNKIAEENRRKEEAEKKRLEEELAAKKEQARIATEKEEERKRIIREKREQAKKIEVSNLNMVRDDTKLIPDRTLHPRCIEEIQRSLGSSFVESTVEKNDCKVLVKYLRKIDARKFQFIESRDGHSVYKFQIKYTDSDGKTKSEMLMITLQNNDGNPTLSGIHAKVFEENAISQLSTKIDPPVQQPSPQTPPPSNNASTNVPTTKIEPTGQQPAQKDSKQGGKNNESNDTKEKEMDLDKDDEEKNLAEEKRRQAEDAVIAITTHSIMGGLSDAANYAVSTAIDSFFEWKDQGQYSRPVETVYNSFLFHPEDTEQKIQQILMQQQIEERLDTSSGDVDTNLQQPSQETQIASSSSSPQQSLGKGKRCFSDRDDDGSSSSTSDDTVHPVSKKPALDTTSEPPIVTASSSPSLNSSHIAPESVGMEELHFTTQESISLELNRIRSDVETLKQNFGDVYQAKVAYDVTGSLAKVARFYQQNGNLEKAELFTKLTAVFCNLAKKTVPYVKAIGTAINNNSTNFQQQFDQFTFDPIGTTAKMVQQFYNAFVESNKNNDRMWRDEQYAKQQLNLLLKKINSFANLKGPQKLEKTTEFMLGLFSGYAFLGPLGMTGVSAAEIAALSEASQAMYGALKLECFNAYQLATKTGLPPESFGGLANVIREFPETLVTSLQFGTGEAQKLFKFALNDQELVTSNYLGKSIAERIKNFAQRFTEKRKLIQTGARDINNVSLSEWENLQKWAAQEYDKIRKMTDDVTKISQATGIPEHKIRIIKEHVFYDDMHLLKDINGNLTTGKVASDDAIAKAWNRLINNDMTNRANDLTLLEHEYFESKFEKIWKTDLRTAHDKTESSGRIWNIPNEDKWQ